MKLVSSLLMLAMMAFSFSASAIDLGDIARGIQIAHDIRTGDRHDSRYDRDYSRPGRPGARVTCNARDKGWEEHGSHGSCGECLRKHGSCIETCAVNYYACRAEGFDRRNVRATFEGRAQSRYEAERQALYSCQRDRRFYNCRVFTCNTASETVSRRSCR